MGHGYPGMAQHLWQEKKRQMNTTWRGTEGEVALWSNWAGWSWWGGGGCGNIVPEERAICSRQCSNLISGSLSFDPQTVQSSLLPSTGSIIINQGPNPVAHATVQFGTILLLLLDLGHNNWITFTNLIWIQQTNDPVPVGGVLSPVCGISHVLFPSGMEGTDPCGHKSPIQVIPVPVKKKQWPTKWWLQFYYWTSLWHLSRTPTHEGNEVPLLEQGQE